MHSTQTQRTFRLVTVNTAPERAKLVIGRLIKGLEGRYEVEHVANCTKIDEVGPAVRTHQPDILFSASMWTPEEAKQIREIAEREKADIKTHAIPQGLQVERGPDGVVEYLLENVPGVLDSLN
ncbi:hypothetical protein K504DRAFT_478082 [Pleomassaria siparia CBS 279.74]|uniref:Uncharacterized protein n=1 Tax=Pleomassaria siparia CBS 279.74 TaxID=1314801 RepID=A0A6G1KPD8_9PLEO|nr:hypothetical protein K504DRAFT_478082 [Pleomassaria siparia CBS 279.74]